MIIFINLIYFYDRKKIINVDETALCYNMPFNKTIHKC